MDEKGKYRPRFSRQLFEPLNHSTINEILGLVPTITYPPTLSKGGVRDARLRAMVR